MKVKEESEKAGLKLNIQKIKIMESSPTTSWQIEGKKSGSSDRFYFLKLQNHSRASLLAQMVKNLPAMKETWFYP